jgi:hypothetical protein
MQRPTGSPQRRDLFATSTGVGRYENTKPLIRTALIRATCSRLMGFHSGVQ